MDQTAALIRTLRPEGQAAAIYLINALRAAGLPAIVVSGRRSAVLQSQLIREGRTTALRSRHLEGRAMDIGFAKVPTTRWRAAHQLHQVVPYTWWASAGGLWKRMGGRWGGDFVNPDLVHFDW